jgi:hypothetical protein
MARAASDAPMTIRTTLADGSQRFLSRTRAIWISEGPNKFFAPEFKGRNVYLPRRVLVMKDDPQ